MGTTFGKPQSAVKIAISAAYAKLATLCHRLLNPHPPRTEGLRPTELLRRASGTPRTAMRRNFVRRILSQASKLPLAPTTNLGNPNPRTRTSQRGSDVLIYFCLFRPERSLRSESGPHRNLCRGASRSVGEGGFLRDHGAKRYPNKPLKSVQCREASSTCEGRDKRYKGPIYVS